MTVIDLTRPLTGATIIALLGDSVAGPEWERYRRIEVETQQSLAEANSAIFRISLADHVGTHVDAPSHVFADGADAAALDIARLCGDAVVLDLTSDDPDHGYTAGDLASAAPPIRRGDIVLIYSGYRDCGPADRIHQTYLTPGGAAWLVEAGVKAVGCEPGGLEHGWDGLHVEHWDDPVLGGPDPWPVHRLLLRNDVYIIEGLTNLDRIAGRRVRFAALPLPVPGLSGSPVRAVAWTGEEE
jgi:kynurenine formamidase